ncbi:hypothetical protein WH06_18115 [Aeromonas salmonicida subsp. salmonicida]|nr:hypothetical protein WH06_18115 [Aeromonas salmonicida subsp. salmonicida]
MTRAHTLGFPRIGAKRELKFALESYWRGETTQAELIATGKSLRERHWQAQRTAGVNLLPVGDLPGTTKCSAPVCWWMRCLPVTAMGIPISIPCSGWPVAVRRPARLPPPPR